MQNVPPNASTACFSYWMHGIQKKKTLETPSGRIAARNRTRSGRNADELQTRSKPRKPRAL